MAATAQRSAAHAARLPRGDEPRINAAIGLRTSHVAVSAIASPTIQKAARIALIVVASMMPTLAQAIITSPTL